MHQLVAEVKPAGKQLCREGPWCPGGQKADYEPLMQPKKSNSILGCTGKRVASGLREISFPATKHR